MSNPMTIIQVKDPEKNLDSRRTLPSQHPTSSRHACAAASGSSLRRLCALFAGAVALLIVCSFIFAVPCDDAKCRVDRTRLGIADQDDDQEFVFEGGQVDALRHKGGERGWARFFNQIGESSYLNDQT